MFWRVHRSPCIAINSSLPEVIQQALAYILIVDGANKEAQNNDKSSIALDNGISFVISAINEMVLNFHHTSHFRDVEIHTNCGKPKA